MTTENRKPETENRCLTIIGGGLAGSEAAWQAARRGVRVRLYEMKPRKFSPAHQSPMLGELVCSNSLRAEGHESAVGLLKEEMRRLDSLIMAAALATRVPAGKALAVDRGEFAAHITRVFRGRALIEIIREEVAAPDPGGHQHHRHRAADLRAPWPRPWEGSPDNNTSTSTTPSPPSWRRSPSTWKKPSGPPATGPGTITSTARFPKPNTPPFTRP